MTKDIANILTNSEVIAVNQDRLARAGNMISRASDGSYEIWGKAIYTEQNNLSGFTPAPRHAVVFLNRLNITVDITLNFDDLFNNNLDRKPPTPNWTVVIRDLWLHQDLGRFEDTWTALNVPAHGVRMVTVSLSHAHR